MLDVRRLRVLREVAARGSFSAAAEALSFTQSAVSQQIAALERESGAKLIERFPRGIRLTEAGRALVDHADAILARLDDAEEELAAIAGLRGGRLRIATFQSAGATLVPRAVGEFHRRHPGVDVTVKQEDCGSERLLLAGEVDVAITMDFEDTPMTEPQLELVHLLDDPYDLVLPRDHALAGRAKVDVADLADERWIVTTVGSGCREGVVNACRASGFAPRLAIESDENTQMQAFVAAGLGVAMFPRLALSTGHPGVVVKPTTGGTLTRRVWAATLAGSYRSPATEAMIEILRDAATEFDATAAPLAVA
jgi:DNA-binding transcriptional LysR family regulator